jgi:hypothetical protein
MTDSGPSTINGRIDFSAADTGQFHNNNGGNIIAGGVHYNVAGVTNALNFVNSLSQTIFGDAGTSVAINGTTTLNASAGTCSPSTVKASMYLMRAPSRTAAGKR